MKKLAFLLGVCVAALVACGGSQGDSCSTEGHVGGQCDDGLVCGKKSDKSGDLTCLKQCSSPADCGPDESCQDVPGGSLQACRPRE